MTPVDPERPAKDTKAEEPAIRLSWSLTAFGATVVDLDADDDLYADYRDDDDDDDDIRKS